MSTLTGIPLKDHLIKPWKIVRVDIDGYSSASMKIPFVLRAQDKSIVPEALGWFVATIIQCLKQRGFGDMIKTDYYVFQ